MTDLLVGVAFGPSLASDSDGSNQGGGPLLISSLRPFSFLHETERQLVGPRATDKRRGDFLRGRWVAKRLISRLTGAAFGPDIRVLRDARGVPEVSLLEKPDVSVRASISHTTGLAAAAAVEAPLQVGVDVERWLNMPEVIARDYFVPREVELYRERSIENHAAAAVIWSLKESMLKVLGEGLRMSTQQVEVLDWETSGNTDWHPAQVRAPIPDESELLAWVHEDDGWVLTLAVLRPFGYAESVTPPAIAECSFTPSELTG